MNKPLFGVALVVAMIGVGIVVGFAIGYHEGFQAGMGFFEGLRGVYLNETAAKNCEMVVENRTAMVRCNP